MTVIPEHQEAHSDKCPSSYKAHIDSYLLWDTTIPLKRPLDLNTGEYKVIFIKAHELLETNSNQKHHAMHTAEPHNLTIQSAQLQIWLHIALKSNHTPCRGAPPISWWGALVVQQLYLLTQDSHGLWPATSTAKAVSSITPFLNLRYKLPECFFSGQWTVGTLAAEVIFKGIQSTCLRNCLIL